MRSVAIIPARGGSKRIPNKNIIDFMGKPMISHTINAALESQVFEDVIVSTDSDRIAEIARKDGAEVIYRNKYADDHTPVSQVIVHVLETLQKSHDRKYETTCQLMPNCPLRNAGDIRDAIKCFASNERNFQISVFKYGWMNPWWAIQQNKGSLPKFLFPDAINKRSQDLPELVCPTGAIWVANTSQLLHSGTFYGPGFQTFPIDWKSAVDIDEPSDLDFAKAVYLMLYGSAQ